jgi:raffinose/stachyose/melibiose transport system permease protein
MTTTRDAGEVWPALRTRVSAPRASRFRRRLAFLNPLGAVGGLVWLVVVLLPLYWVVVTSLRGSEGFFSSPPLSLPTQPSLGNYREVLHGSFLLYLRNSAVVTMATVAFILIVSIMAAYAIVRGTHWTVRLTMDAFLLGLAIPVQATIIPIYAIISRLGLYDTLTALVLPGVAFGIPLTVIILVNFLRDVPGELFEAMRIDGAGEWRMLWSLVLPLARPAVLTVAIYDALNTWNAFLFPLILIQTARRRVLPLGVWEFQGQFNVNVPAVLAFVVLSSLPVIAMYILGRRQLVSGLLAGFGK